MKDGEHCLECGYGGCVRRLRYCRCGAEVFTHYLLTKEELGNPICEPCRIAAEQEAGGK